MDKKEAARQFSEETGMSPEKMALAGIVFEPCPCGGQAEWCCTGWMARVK